MKPFEVVAQLSLVGLPTSADVAQVSERLEKARRKTPAVVRATVQTPALFREGSYVLETRLVVWAADGQTAMGAVEGLLDAAAVRYRGMHLSGRALTEADVPRPAPARPVKAARARGAAPKASAKARAATTARRKADARKATRRKTRAKPARAKPRARQATKRRAGGRSGRRTGRAGGRKR